MQCWGSSPRLYAHWAHLQLLSPFNDSSISTRSYPKLGVTFACSHPPTFPHPRHLIHKSHWPSFKIQPNAFFTECGNALLIHLFASSLAPFLLHTIIPAGLPKGRMDCIYSSAQMPHSSCENQHPHKGLQGLPWLPKVSSHSHHPCELVLSTPDSLTPLQPY